MFDACAGQLAKRRTLIRNGLLVLSYQSLYQNYYAVPFVSQSLYLSLGASVVMSLLNLGSMFGRMNSIVRMSLVPGDENKVELVTGFGRTLYVKVEELKYVGFISAGGIVQVNLSND